MIKSKLTCIITATGLSANSFVDQNSDVNIEGSSLTSSQTTGTVVFAGINSRLNFRNVQILGNSGTSVKLTATSAASVYANGSNLTSANTVISTPAILHF